jgi:hypothetical protein
LRDSNGDNQNADANGNYGGVGPYTVIYLDKNNYPLSVGASIDQRVIEDQNIAGFISESNLDSAFAKMFAKNTDSYSAVIAAITGDKSVIQLIADEVSVPNKLVVGESNGDRVEIDTHEYSDSSSSQTVTSPEMRVYHGGVQTVNIGAAVGGNS